jgi:glycosyltransferase involved in cell wall biosynthesis
MSAGPAVSIIVPNYGHAPYLRQRLDSSVHQMFGDRELILLDDASTDNSVQVIECYARCPNVGGLSMLSGARRSRRPPSGDVPRVAEV